MKQLPSPVALASYMVEPKGRVSAMASKASEVMAMRIMVAGYRGVGASIGAWAGPSVNLRGPLTLNTTLQLF
jgi:hypothetical protein